MGIRILFLCGGETFLWQDNGYNLRDLVIEAKQLGFFIVNVVTNGTFKLDLPEADLILLSLDGNEEKHNLIRGNTYSKIINNIQNATSDNICIYMAINKLNKDNIEDVCKIVIQNKNVRAISFNFHTPYPNTKQLAISRDEKEQCCNIIRRMKKQGVPIFNLINAFPYLIDNNFPTPCNQCVVIENNQLYTCGRCIKIPDLCNECGYFFVAEYTLLFQGKLKIIFEMINTYLKYI